jgi:hypothetical protein
MSYQSDLTTALSAASTITAIVGTRIYADVADGSAAAPYLVWQVISTGGETTHDGGREIEEPLIQFSCWGTSKESVIALASALNVVIDGNTISGASGLTFQFSNQFGTYESDTNLFGEILEYRASCITN